MYLRCQNIAFGYNPYDLILNWISFSIEKGQTLAIVGASGSGKSTLLRIISNILPNAKSNTLQGEITIDGQNPNEYRKSGKLAFMFQEPTLMPQLNVKENISFPLRIKKTIDVSKVEELINLVGLGNYQNYLPKQLSGGMKTRVALARSFSTTPELLLLDEPFSALDIAWKSKLYVELEKLKEQNNTTVILVTHDVQEALLLSDKVFVLGNGGRKLIEMEVTDTYPIMHRLQNISKFINTEQFQQQYSTIQNAVLIDAVITRIQSVAGNAEMESWDGMEKDISSIIEYLDISWVNQLLFSSLAKATTYNFNYHLVWILLQSQNISNENIEVLANAYLKHLLPQSIGSIKNKYNHNGHLLFEYLINDKINSNDIPENKRWIFLCDLYASSEKEKVLDFLYEVKKGKIMQLNYSLAREVAEKVFLKIGNEKQDSIYIA